MTVNKPALKFAVGDTIAATPINLALNYVFLKLAFDLEMTPEMMAPFLTATFFFIAVARKYFLRVFFDRKKRLKPAD
jgi:hypothetical protein